MTETQKKKSTFKSCLLPGCLGLIIMIAIIGVVSFFATKSFVNKTIDTHTSEEPAEIVTTVISEEDYRKVEENLEKFEAAVESNNNAQASEPFQLELSERDINSLIANSKDLNFLKDKMAVKLSGDTILADVSWPLSDFANIPLLGSLEDRFFNGSIELDVSINNGELEIFLLGAEANGQSIPSTVISELASENLANEFLDDPDFREFVEGLESFEIKDGKAIIVTR